MIGSLMMKVSVVVLLAGMVLGVGSGETAGLAPYHRRHPDAGGRGRRGDARHGLHRHPRITDYARSHGAFCCDCVPNDARLSDPPSHFEAYPWHSQMNRFARLAVGINT